MNRILTTLFLFTVVISTTSARVLRHAESDKYPRYAFKYAVHDPVTKDHKEHWEASDGGVVKGAYALVEPDGKLRVVDYWADDANGFNADVKRFVKKEDLPEPAPVVEHDAPDDTASKRPAANEKTEEPSSTPAPNSDVMSNDVITDELFKPLSPVLTSNEVSEPLNLLAIPDKYGFGSGDEAPLGRLYTSVGGTGSLRWDPKTGSYGGWVPLPSSALPYATIFSKKYIDGKLHEWAIGPISLKGRTLVFKVKH